MSEFDELLKSLQTVADDNEELAKALPTDDADDEKVEAAAEEAGAVDPDADPAADEPEDDKEPMAKSITIDGEEFEAVDATELIKSLTDRIGSNESVLAKALETTVAALNSQSTLIKSLQAEVKSLGAQGRGRKTVLTVLEKPGITSSTPAETLAKSQSQDGVTHEEFFAKANSLFDCKKISGSELNMISVSLREKQPIDQKLVTKILNTNV